jgi:hypothetical protein
MFPTSTLNRRCNEPREEGLEFDEIRYVGPVRTCLIEGDEP